MLFGIIYTLSNCTHSKFECDYSLMRNFNEDVSRMIIKIPKICDITDSTIVGNTNTIKNYWLESIDSSIMINIFVESIDGYPENRKTIVKQRDFNKNKLLFIRQSLKELLDTVIVKNNIEIGYSKYYTFSSQRNSLLIEGKIFFYREGKLVVVTCMEKYTSEVQKQHSTSDCVFESLAIY